jgi:hypothetical protein
MTNIQINWKEGDTVTLWTEKCVSIIEAFGLPGDKYFTKVTEDYMLFSFIDAEDALVAKLIVGG